MFAREKRGLDAQLASHLYEGRAPLQPLRAGLNFRQVTLARRPAVLSPTRTYSRYVGV